MRAPSDEMVSLQPQPQRHSRARESLGLAKVVVLAELSMGVDLLPAADLELELEEVGGHILMECFGW